ncbi:hypothetical protein BC834DRAFT_925275 [Gloeopeniophorella convolvens]|nr:hypothetical protein BC834DRAFT_925275 [Gloeopeniophorella convolvens]
MKRKASEEPGSAQDDRPSSSKEYESGRVTCETCGESVSYRDERTGAFTTKHWDAHKLKWCPSEPPAESTSAGPPSKRRRAKRSEEERIKYLRSDPYVAQFEPYRVLCASCDKWIRLRPNSTYCSIPWDAHRKSCLARKGTKIAVPPFAAGDPDARKYDGERVFCGACSTWVAVGSEEQAARAWSQHRAQCQSGVPPPPHHQMALASMPALPPPPPRPSKEQDRPPSPPAPSAPQALQALQASDASAPTPAAVSAPGTGSESRRRNAEQRAAQLRADPLLAHVEPHRVFCALCSKWVQLRQDSTFCAYPWQQHRTKCVIRHEKKAKVTVAGGVAPSDDPTPASGDDEDEDEDASADGADPDTDAGASAGLVAHGHAHADSQAPRFADLDSPADRLSFTRHSISYLFRTTYTAADTLTIAALVAYMNAALPPDKHEEFDTAEVIRAAKALRDRGRIAFEGDTLKVLH